MNRKVLTIICLHWQAFNAINGIAVFDGPLPSGLLLGYPSGDIAGWVSAYGSRGLGFDPQ